MKRILLVLAMLSVGSGCKYSARTNNTVSANGLQLAEADYEVLDWVDAKACATYIFFLRIPEKDEDEKGGKREGIISAGSILGGGGAPDPDSADALYGALVKMPEATHLINPRYTVQSSGFLAGLLGRPMFGRRCAKVRARGLSLGAGPYFEPNAR
ncbi:MAG: hypothetical protein CL927_19220 [Deltaproteobacteria bacterium]|nr:hypothetical protein [Deltaproteobacteria bacterium]HCH67006.1 hypothetical protein [Deltaproteobacteria bacterium]